MTNIECHTVGTVLKYHTVGTVPKSNRKIVERGKTKFMPHAPVNNTTQRLWMDYPFVIVSSVFSNIYLHKYTTVHIPRLVLVLQ